MNGKATLSCWLGALLTVLWTGLSPGQSGPLNEGRASSEALAPADVAPGRWQRIMGQLKANGLSMESAQECLAPVQDAARQDLPSDPVLTRVEEGAAKGVEAKALQEAGRQRLANLQGAAEVLRQAGYGSRNTQHDQLMKSVTLALESGLSADTLRGVLIRAKGGQSERMRSIVEAGQTLRLCGLDEITAGQMMTDFTERNMRRTEVIRASRFAVQQHRAHVNGARIRQQLWDGTGRGVRSRYGEGIPGSGGPGPGPGGRAAGSGSPAGSGNPSKPGSETAGSGGGGAGAGGPSDPVGGSAGSGAQSGQGGPSASPGNAPAAPGGGGSGSGGAGSSGLGGSSGQGENAPATAGSQGSTPTRGR